MSKAFCSMLNTVANICNACRIKDNNKNDYTIFELWLFFLVMGIIDSALRRISLFFFRMYSSMEDQKKLQPHSLILPMRMLWMNFENKSYYRMLLPRLVRSEIHKGWRRIYNTQCLYNYPQLKGLRNSSHDSFSFFICYIISSESCASLRSDREWLIKDNDHYPTFAELEAYMNTIAIAYESSNTKQKTNPKGISKVTKERKTVLVANEAKPSGQSSSQPIQLVWMAH